MFLSSIFNFYSIDLFSLFNPMFVCACVSVCVCWVYLSYFKTILTQHFNAEIRFIEDKIYILFSLSRQCNGEDSRLERSLIEAGAEGDDKG